MKASILSLRKNMSDLINALDMNEAVTLTYRGKDKAKIVPITHSGNKKKITEDEAFGLWSDKKDDVAKTLRDIRKGRVDAV